MCKTSSYTSYYTNLVNDGKLKERVCFFFIFYFFFFLPPPCQSSERIKSMCHHRSKDKDTRANHIQRMLPINWERRKKNKKISCQVNELHSPDQESRNKCRNFIRLKHLYTW